MGTIRTVLYGIAGVGVAGTMGATHLFGDAKVYVIAPAEEPVEVYDAKSNDLLTSVAGNTMASFKLAQGEHELKLHTAQDDSVLQINLDSGFTDMVLPLQGQCFVRFEVTDYMYETKNSNADPLLSIKVVDRYEDKPFELESNTYYLDHGMPDEVKENRDVYSLGMVPCEELQLSDQQLIAAFAGEEE